jgi:hypothetical protein
VGVFNGQSFTVQFDHAIERSRKAPDAKPVEQHLPSELNGPFERLRRSLKLIELKSDQITVWSDQAPKFDALRKLTCGLPVDYLCIF